MRPVLALVAAAAAGVLLSGCGADVSQGDDREPVPERVRAGLATLYAGPAPSPDLLTEGECFATELDDRLTLDELAEAGLVRDDGEVVVSVPMLEVGAAEAWVDAMGACTTYPEVAAREAASRGYPDAAAFASCLEAAVPAERVREALVATLTGRFGTDPAAVELADAQDGCRSGDSAAG